MIETDIDNAIEILDYLHKLNPGQGDCFSSLTIAKLRKRGISKKPPLVVSCQMLGQWGRFGNQIQQYMTVLAFGHMLGFETRVPYWIGSSLFESPFSDNFPKVEPCNRTEIEDIQTLKIVPKKSIDIGTEQADFGFLWNFRNFLRPHFRSKFCTDATSELIAAGFRPEQTIALHLRGTDSRGSSLQTNVELGLGTLTRLLQSYPAYDAVVVTDDLDLLNSHRSGLPLKLISKEKLQYSDELGFLYDWLILKESAVVIYNSQSTFSATAVLTGNQNRNCYPI